jgi:ABC-type phosphate transport system ATPase subunit
MGHDRNTLRAANGRRLQLLLVLAELPDVVLLDEPRSVGDSTPTPSAEPAPAKLRSKTA